MVKASGSAFKPLTRPLLPTAENHPTWFTCTPLLPGRPALPAWGVPSAFLWLTRPLRGGGSNSPPLARPPGAEATVPAHSERVQRAAAINLQVLQAHSGVTGGWRRVGGQAETLLESAPFINFGIPQASVFSSLLTLSTHPGEGGCRPHTHRPRKEKPDTASWDEGGREEASSHQEPPAATSSHQQPQGPHGEELTFREPIVAGR